MDLRKERNGKLWRQYVTPAEHQRLAELERLIDRAERALLPLKAERRGIQNRATQRRRDRELAKAMRSHLVNPNPQAQP